MLYLEVGPKHVRCFLGHSEAKADRWSFVEVLAGDRDAEVRAYFGDAVVDELKAAVRKRIS